MFNGAIVAIYTRVFDRTGVLFAPKSVAYMMPAECSVDIDYKEHIIKAIKQMRQAGRKLLKPELNTQI